MNRIRGSLYAFYFCLEYFTLIVLLLLKIIIGASCSKFSRRLVSHQSADKIFQLRRSGN